MIHSGTCLTEKQDNEWRFPAREPPSLAYKKIERMRSGKIMRRVLAAISNTLDTVDITTLANPDVVEQIRITVQGKEKLAFREGPEDLKQFGTQE